MTDQQLDRLNLISHILKLILVICILLAILFYIYHVSPWQIILALVAIALMMWITWLEGKIVQIELELYGGHRVR